MAWVPALWLVAALQAPAGAAERRLVDATDITGRVTDAASGAPLEGAVVVVRGTALQAISRADGRYAVVNRSEPGAPNHGVSLGGGEFALEIRAQGHAPFCAEGVRVQPGQVTVRDIALHPGGGGNRGVKVAPGGRYFLLEDGTPFIPAGYHHQIVYGGFCFGWRPTQGKPWWPYNPAIPEHYARKLADAGVNFLRIFLEDTYPLGAKPHPNRLGMFQDPPGTYAPDVIDQWDRLFDFADRYGFKILVSLYQTDQVRAHWRLYPFSASRGGPGPETLQPGEWYSSPALRACHRRDWAFVIDRWGQRDGLFGFDLMNEAHMHWEATPQQVGDWLREMVPFVRQRMARRWGRQTLLTVSGSPGQSGPDMGLYINNPGLDFVTTHNYDGPIGNPVTDKGRRVDVVLPALAMREAVARVMERTDPVKPYLDTEWGPIHAGIELDSCGMPGGQKSPAADETYFHNVTWAHVAAGAAGAPARWLFRPGLTDRMLADLGSVRRFLEGVDTAPFRPQALPADRLRVDALRGKVHALGCADRDQAILWLLVDREPMPAPDPRPAEETTVRIRHWRRGGRFRVRVWDTHRGCAAAETEVRAAPGEELRLPLRRIDRDVALALRRL
ncbi:MAG: carboxypeptidase regulatory-like domain-containing protein [Lentisphaeria bacterium]|nr:carboxypeptidase regulatory-like domain-containing protein [Lentisphaeria bacterium]